MSARERFEEESGYDAQYARYEAAADIANAIEEEIAETVPVTLAGLFVRLRVLRDFLESNNTSYGKLTPREDMEWQDRLTLDVMDDLVRLTAGGVS